MKVVSLGWVVIPGGGFMRRFERALQAKVNCMRSSITGEVYAVGF